jgi:hypothetical protein
MVLGKLGFLIQLFTLKRRRLKTVLYNNPQQSAAYIAGFIDGEATIRVRRQANRASQYHPQIKIAQKSRAVLDYVAGCFGGWIREYQPHSLNGRACRAFEWTLEGREAVLRIMLAIQPYVIVKRPQVALMIEFIREGEIPHPPNPISSDELARRIRVFGQFKRLNHRGIVVCSN